MSVETLWRSRKLAKDSLAAHRRTDTDGESMTPESQRSSTSAPDGLLIVYDLIGDDPDASFAAYDLLIG